MATLGERIRELRKSRGVTMDKLAEAVGVKKRVLAYYESGDREPSLGVLLQLADFFDVSLDYLVGRSDDPERR